jgi:hypothetical protein
MKIKFHVLDKLKVFKALAKKQIGKKIKELKCDGVGSIILRISMHYVQGK